MRSVLRRVLEIVTTMAAMSGFRLGHLDALWVGLGALSLGLARFVDARRDPTLVVVYFVVTALAYHLGNALILGTRARARWIERAGEQRAFRQYERTLALMFFNQGLGLGAVSSLDVGVVMPIPATLALVVGLGCIAVGMVVKVWSTMVLGVDIYYYKDLFLGRPVSTFVSRGPYRVLANPMYGVGYLTAYGWALCQRSVAALVAGAACHASIWAFHFVVERPFVRRTYLTAA